jgi:Tfp pilus assembly PilM family ATPase
MAVGREFSVLEIDGTRLAAVSAVVTGDRIAVRRWLIANRPETVPGDRAAAVGEWIGSEFARAQLAKSRTILAVSRSDVVLKQLSLPQSAALTPHELANVVRLQMVRQLTMQIEGTAIDYLPPVAHPGISSQQLLPVMAGAMPSDRVAWSRELVQSAGLKLRRIGLRCFGAASLLADLSQEALLAVSPTRHRAKHGHAVGQ